MSGDTSGLVGGIAPPGVVLSLGLVPPLGIEPPLPGVVEEPPGVVEEPPGVVEEPPGVVEEPPGVLWAKESGIALSPVKINELATRDAITDFFIKKMSSDIEETTWAGELGGIRVSPEILKASLIHHQAL